MKKLIFILALAALCGAAFANNVSDPGVTLRGWDYFSSSAPAGFVSLADGKGFAVTAAGYGRDTGFAAYDVSGWVFDENESSEEDVEVAENVLVFGSDSELETGAEESTNEGDDITVFIDALEANDIEDEIVFEISETGETSGEVEESEESVAELAAQTAESEAADSTE